MTGAQDNPDRRLSLEIEMQYLVDKSLCVSQVVLKVLDTPARVANGKLCDS